MIELRAVKGPTGRLLQKILGEKGIQVGKVGAKAIISYGMPVKSSFPTLNANAGRLNKYQELVQLAANSVRVPRHWLKPQDSYFGKLLGRNFKHTKGKDIAVSSHAAIAGKDYYTEFVAHSREFRVYVFRRHTKAAYEKLQRYKPKKVVKETWRDPSLVWNWRNGYAFEFLPPENRPEGLNAIACAAVDALDLDFGAVDIILGNDNRLYVLEVNTAPGVQDRRQGLTALADSMVKWAKGGYKKRKGEDE